MTLNDCCNNILFKFTVDTFVLETPPGMGFDNAWVTMDTKRFEFKVQACKDAMMALYNGSPDLTVTHDYEIIIGAQDNSFIELYSGPNKTLLYRAPYSGALNCGEARPFFVDWNNNMLRVQYFCAYVMNRIKVFASTKILHRFRIIQFIHINIRLELVTLKWYL